MIYIYSDTINTVVTRFSDRRKLSNSYFVWVVKNEISGKVNEFILEDTSLRPYSYNLFELDHTFACDLDTICLEAGHNTYQVYESTENSLDPQYRIGLIESDIMFVELTRTVNTVDSQSENVYN